MSRLLSLLRESRAGVQRELDSAIQKKQRLLDDLAKTTDSIQQLSGDLKELDDEIDTKVAAMQRAKEVHIKEEPDTPGHP